MSYWFTNRLSEFTDVHRAAGENKLLIVLGQKVKGQGHSETKYDYKCAWGCCRMKQGETHNLKW